MEVQQGQFVEVRGRPWLVESVDDTQPDLTTLRLSCIADDAQGEQIEVLWDAEIGTRIMQDDTWAQVGRGAPDSPEVLAAYLRAIRWKSATAADRNLLRANQGAGDCGHAQGDPRQRGPRGSTREGQPSLNESI